MHRSCAAVVRDGSILMVYCDHGTHAHWTLPGGGLEGDESPEEAVIRELRDDIQVSRVIEALGI